MGDNRTGGPFPAGPGAFLGLGSGEGWFGTQKLVPKQAISGFCWPACKIRGLGPNCAGQGELGELGELGKRPGHNRPGKFHLGSVVRPR